jgi:uncharacterized protein (DUF488 family)
MTIYTVGVYGWTADTFADALVKAGVTALVDIRRRRAARGPRHRFANAKALETLVKAHGVGYLAEPRLSPTAEIRTIQKEADAESRVQKRDRGVLAPRFIEAYERDILTEYSLTDLDALMVKTGRSPVFLCVERHPLACHRSLAAIWVATRVNGYVTHLTPP